MLNRDKLINAIDRYNNEYDWKKLDAAIEQVTGMDPDYLDDSDPNEGMYADISTENLQKILNVLQGKTADAKKYTISDLTYEEYALIQSAVEMFSDPAFSKSRKDASTAKHIMTKQGW